MAGARSGYYIPSEVPEAFQSGDFVHKCPIDEMWYRERGERPTACATCADPQLICSWMKEEMAE